MHISWTKSAFIKCYTAICTKILETYNKFINSKPIGFGVNTTNDKPPFIIKKYIVLLFIYLYIFFYRNERLSHYT